MDYNVRLSSSKEIFRNLLTGEYHVDEEKVEKLIEDCESSLRIRFSSPLYDVVFHRVVRDVLRSHGENCTYVC